MSLLVAVPAAISADQPTPETTGAFHATAFAPLPKESRIEIRLMDDSPENLEIGWRIQQELQRHGYAKGGTKLVLTIATDVSIAGGKAAADSGEPGDLDVIGFLQATLDNTERNERLWAAEAAYKRSDGDLPAGAKALAPLLVEQIGKSIELKSVRIR